MVNLRRRQNEQKKMSVSFGWSKVNRNRASGENVIFTLSALAILNKYIVNINFLSIFHCNFYRFSYIGKSTQKTKMNKNKTCFVHVNN